MNDPQTRKKLLWVAALGGALLLSLVFISTLAPDGNQSVGNSPVIRTADASSALPGTTPAAENNATSSDEVGSGGGFSLGGGQLVSLAWRLLLVIIIIAVSIAGLRWWGRRAAVPKSSTGFLRVIDTLAISNGRSIHLVALGDRVIAVGATAQQLTLLNELSEGESSQVLSDSARPDEVPLTQFAAHLFESMKRSGQRAPRERAETVIGGEQP